MIDNNRLLAHAEKAKEPQKFHMLCGIPGSGKSTFVKEKLTGEIVSLDGIREKKYGDAAIQGNPKEVVEESFRLMNENLSNGKDVIYDATNLRILYRKNAIDIAKQYNATVILHWINTSLEEAKLRNNKRERHVPENIIESFQRDFERPSTDEGIDMIIKYDKDFNIVEQILPQKDINKLTREVI